MATAVLLPNGKQTFLDGNGEPLAGGSVYFYIPNTTTFKNTWQDPLEQTLNTNPVLLDSAGTAIVYGEGQYRQIVKDSSGNTIWDQLTSSPPTVGPQATLSSASTTDLGSTNVNVIEITGTTTINSFGSSADVNVPIYFLTFSGALTLTYNATSMILPGAGNITTQPKASCVALYLGSGDWQVISYTAAGQIPGTSTNDNASAGSVGEIITAAIASGSAISLTSGTPKNITSISLTPGDWDVTGVVNFTGGTITTINLIAAIISASTNSATSTDQMGYNQQSYEGSYEMFQNQSQTSLFAGPTRVSLAATTTYYLNANANFGSSTASAYGMVRARRVR